MKFTLAAVLFFLSFSVADAQKTNEAIKSQIRSLKADKSISLTFDGNSSKVMAVASNFSDADAKAAGLQAMNFGMAFFYPGTTLASTPATINFSFWAMAKKPRFAGGSHLVVTLTDGELDLGDSRYAAKPNENMEYLNFVLQRDDLAKIAASPSPVKFKLGGCSLSFTTEQMGLLKNVISVSDAK